MEGLSPNTLVLMSDGTLKQIKDIMVDDNVMGPDSKPKKVIETYIGRDAMYTVITEKGQIFTCNSNHLLSLYNDNKYELLCVKKYNPKRDTNLYLLNIPINFPEQELEEPLEDIIEKIGKFLHSNDYMYRPRIPLSLLINSYSVRNKLLQGILFYINKYQDFHEIEIFHNDGLVRDLEDLCLSLGIMITKRQRVPAQVHSYTLRIHIRPSNLLGNILDPLETQLRLINNRKQKFTIKKRKNQEEYCGIKLEYTDQWNGNYVLHNYIVVHD
jgi:hypothetical protein